MVMMGQQYLNTERKKEDDIDHIKPHNNHTNRTTEEQKQSSISQDNMKKREIPTLATLAQISHDRHQSTTVNTVENGTEGGGEGENNNKVITQIVELELDNPSKCTDNAGLKANGDKGSQYNVDVHDQDRSNDTAPSNQTSSTAGTGEATTTSSGRTSSCDSSGIGASLTSSSSSEPIEREEIVSPSSDHGGASTAPTTSNGVDEDVPDNNGSGRRAESTTPKVSTTVIPNGVASGSGSCQALLLAEEFNGQMTVAKKFLKMVRDGINDSSANGSVTTTTTTSSSRLKGGDSSTDEDTSISTSVNKPSILSSGTSNNINGTIVPNNIETKGKPVTSSGGRGAATLTKIANSVPGIAAALNLHPILEKGPPPSCVQEVWAHNLLEEFAKIRKIVKQYTYIAMDTEFPGIVVRPQCAVRGAGVFPYELLKVNVDRLKIIQLGVTFMDKDGKCPPGVCTWQFNFKFSLNKDLYASDSISLLTRCGIQFERHAEMGINPEMFGEYFMSSGMVTSDQVTYLTFHSGFDFGYLIKLLSNLPLPDNEEKFFEIMKIYFPNVYDLKFLMKSVDLHGGLQDIANQMGQERVGTQHQAGSDSLLTGMTFFKLLSTDVFNGEIDEAKYCGKLYGFHMMEDGNRDDGWNEITGENLLDATSPKPPPPVSRTTNSNGTTSNSLHPSTQSSQHSSSVAGNSLDNR